jgi:hypothetical protein
MNPTPSRHTNKVHIKKSEILARNMPGNIIGRRRRKM